MSETRTQSRYPAEISHRISQLETLSALVHTRVPIPHTDIELEVIHPASIDALLDEIAGDPELNLPYWAEIWPSGIALASIILQSPYIVNGRPVIELGCGAGITSAAAIMAGAKLVATDYSPHSLMITELTCLLAGQYAPTMRQVNWRSPDAQLLQDCGDAWPIVLAADVLYERRDIEPMLNLLERIVAPSGTVLLAEPGRAHARTFLHMAVERGWEVETDDFAGPWPGANCSAGNVAVHKMVKGECLH